MPTPFDAELYLRLAGEKGVVDPDRERHAPWDLPFVEVGSALVAIGALPPETAQAIIDDYQLALFLRGDSNGARLHMMRSARSRPSSRQALIAPRVVACDADLDQPWGRLHVQYVALGQATTSLAVSALETPPRPTRRGGPMPFGRVMQQLSITDDQGTTVSAHFTGGGGPSEWRGRLTTHGPLSAATRWLDIGPSRLELSPGERVPPALHIEPLTGTDLAERYLGLRLATGSRGHAGGIEDLEAAIGTLVAAGALDKDAQVIADTRAVVAAFTGQSPRLGTATPAFGTASPAVGAVPAVFGVVPAVFGVVPAAWASLLARQGSASGPSRTIPVGVATPPIDGVAIIIEGLVSTDDVFELHVVTSPGIAHMWQQSADSPRIAWWAEDDRGNHYLGAPGNWSGGSHDSQGTIDYWPPLDARATELRLMPTGLTERAVVTLPLLPSGASGRP